MSAQAAIDSDADFAEVPDENQIALLANIKDLTDGRDRAIEHWLSAYDSFHAKTALAGSASIAGAIGFGAPSSHNQGPSEKLTRAFLNAGPVSSYNRETGRSTEYPARDAYRHRITQEVDRRCWSTLIKNLGFDVLLDRQAREEFQASLQDSSPEFTPDNATATFGHLWGNRRDMYLRGIANTFMAMDRRFRSHDAFEIGNRLIIVRAFSVDSSWWVNDNWRDTLHDVERIFRELDGKPPIAMQYGIDRPRRGEPEPIGPKPEVGIVGKVVNARQDGNFPMLVANDYFRVRVFQNGNLHLWFERKDLLKEINALLLEYYKPVEGDVGEGPSYESAPLFHSTPAKNFGQFFSSEAVADKVIDLAELRPGMLVLEPSAGSGMLAKAARAAGGEVHCIEMQSGLAHELRALHGFQEVRTMDFLSMAPQPRFDRIVMNPPFDRGRDCDHVRHAYGFLKPGGKLVAVMSARAEFGTDARHKALHELVEQGRNKWGGGGGRWHDLPEKSFAHAGTNVNTVMLVLEKPRN